MKLAAILAAAASFFLGMAFNEFLHPAVSRWRRRRLIGRLTDSIVAKYADALDALASDDWATDPRTDELATGGGQEGAK